MILVIMGVSVRRNQVAVAVVAVAVVTVRSEGVTSEAVKDAGCVVQWVAEVT